MKNSGWIWYLGAAFCAAVFVAAAVSDSVAPTVAADNAPAAAEGQFAWSDDEAWRAKQAYIAWEETGEAAETDKDLIARYYMQDDGGGARNPLDAQGGPDLFGYRWVDNQAPDTASFNWIELDGDPLAVNLTFNSRDDGYSPLYPLGFNFPFYGAPQDSFRVITNGSIQFTTQATTFSNACLPASGVAGPAIFPFWDDLHLDRGGDTLGTDIVSYRSFGTYAVIQFDSIGFYNSTCTGEVLRFQAILYANGRIKVQYHTMNMPSACDSSATVGIQQAGASGSIALQYACNLTGEQPVSGRAVWFYPSPPLAHDFRTLSVQSPTGLVEPGSAVTVRATFQNVGSTTEASPVRYRFNNGTTVTEFTPVLAQFAIDSHQFNATFTAPATPGQYSLSVWTDLSTDQSRGNDTVTVTVNVQPCIDFTLNAPGEISSSTCGAGNDCPLRPSQDRMIRVNIPSAGDWTFALCVPSPIWDSYMYLTTECCGGTTIDTDDDGCPESGVGHPMIECVPLAAGTYYVDVEAFSSTVCSTFTLTVTQCGAPTPPNPDSLVAYFTPTLPAPVNLPNRGIRLSWTPGTGAAPSAYYLYQVPAGGTEFPPTEYAGAMEWAPEEGTPELFVGVNMNTGEFRNNRYHVTASNELPPQSAELVIDPNVATGTLNVPAGTNVVAFRFVWQSGPYVAASNHTWLNNPADAARWRGNTGAWSDRKRVAGQISSRKQYWVVADSTPGCIQLTSRFYDANGNFLVQVSRTICFQ